jgi:tRNA G37 N-methylase Trm5
LEALRYNLKANGVESRTTVLEGDCRISLRRLIEQQSHTTSSNNNDCCNQFDRISLGLLPSSEGGWVTAVSCLRRSTGGWLHVHGNVPTAEQKGWTHWLCRSLARISAKGQRRRNSDDGNGDESNRRSDWIAVCTHVEKVKSFAPRIDHVVADVFVGPRDSPLVPLPMDGISGYDNSTGVVDSLLGRFDPTPCVASPPSCALSEAGVLHQDWLREQQ